MPDFENNEADNAVDDTTYQDSPSDETNEVEVETDDTGENLDETPSEETDTDVDSETSDNTEDINWRETRARLKALEDENQALKSQVPNTSYLKGVRDSGTFSPVVDPSVNMKMELDEFKAKTMFPELDDKNKGTYDKSFDREVAGEFSVAYNTYLNSTFSGLQVEPPSITDIARQVKQERETKFGTATQKAKSEGAKQAKQSKVARESTVEATGRSDRAVKQVSSDELSRLRAESRQPGRRGDQAVYARLKALEGK